MLGKLFVVEGPEDTAKKLCQLLKAALDTDKIESTVINPFKDTLLANLVTDMIESNNKFEIGNHQQLNICDLILSVDIRIDFLFNSMMKKIIPAIYTGQTVVLETYIDSLLADSSQTGDITMYITNAWKHRVDSLKYYPEELTIIYCKPDSVDIIDQIDRTHYDDYLVFVKKHNNATVIELDISDKDKLQETIDLVTGKEKPVKKFKLVSV
jgi:thymidylate kinase